MKTKLLIITSFMMSFAGFATAQYDVMLLVPEVPDYVDLGLPSGTLWATCNVGADNPEDNGDYFAWGEIKPKSGGYDGSTSTYHDNPETLPPSHDAATANLGSGWCMPTLQQIEELKEKCTWTWATRNGKNGYVVMGENGNSIFLPAAGYIYPSLVNVGEDGFYWSSSLAEDNPAFAWDLHFDSGRHDNYRYYNRESGFPVRPVRSMNNRPSKINHSQTSSTQTSTTQASTTNNTHTYVDLGLPSGTLWATCNIGATNPEDNGDYFAWGETKTKNDYSVDTYTYHDNPETLTPSHDAATANWGSDWCMPTIQQINERAEECTWTWTTRNGKKGYEIMGKNGNSIFLPAAGYRYMDRLHDNGLPGDFYWSSDLYRGDSAEAWGLHFFFGCISEGYDDRWGRYLGLSVRAVRSKK